MQHPDVSQVGLFGSYGKGQWGPGSDADIVVIVRDTNVPFQQRPLDYNTTVLPVPADLIVYTEREWENLRTTLFYRTVTEEVVWLHPATTRASVDKPAKGHSSGAE